MTKIYHPFYGYLISLANAGLFKPKTAEQYYDAAEKGLATLGHAFDTVTLNVIVRELPRFKRGGDLYRDHTSYTALRHLRDYLAANSNSPTPMVFTAPTPFTPKRTGAGRRTYSSSNIPDLPFLGIDHDCEHVRYDEQIPQGRRVPGLAKHLEERYGAILDFLGSRLLNPFEREWGPRKIQVVLKEDKPKDVFPIDSKKRVLKQWEIRKEKPSNEEIIDMLRRDKIESRVLGTYFGGSHPLESHIELYYTNTDPKPIDLYFALFEGVLAHEYAHHLHHCYLRDHFFQTSKEAVAIQESIADFASYLYLISAAYPQNPAETIAAEKLNGWKKYFGSGWPYAEAYWFFHLYGVFANGLNYPRDRDAEEKLISVFELSTNYGRAIKKLRS